MLLYPKKVINKIYIYIGGDEVDFKTIKTSPGVWERLTPKYLGALAPKRASRAAGPPCKFLALCG